MILEENNIKATISIYSKYLTTTWYGLSGLCPPKKYPLIWLSSNIAQTTITINDALVFKANADNSTISSEMITDAYHKSLLCIISNGKK